MLVPPPGVSSRACPTLCGVLEQLSVGLLVLICADVIRSSLDWLLRFAPARHNLAVEMTRTRDPSDAFTALTALCRSGRVGLQSQQQALTNVAIIMVAKGGPVEQVRVARRSRGTSGG